MAKHAKKSDHLQIVESAKALVEVPLPARTRARFLARNQEVGRS